MSEKGINEGFGLRFRLLMSYHDLTLREIAEETGSAISTVGTWKNGRQPASAGIVRKLARLFGVSEAFLLEGRPNGRGETFEPTDALGQLAWQVGEADLLEEGFGQGESGRPSQRARRLRIERYLARYLDEAEQHPDGLAHAWIEVQRTFPLGLFGREAPQSRYH